MNRQRFLMLAITPMVSQVLIIGVIALPKLTWIQFTIMLLLAALNGISINVAILVAKEQ